MSAEADAEKELGDGLPRLTEGNWGEILVRGPAMDVLRCRAVCRAWRDITTGLSFPHRPRTLLGARDLVVQIRAP